MNRKIKTSNKTKLPMGLSYPFGAEDISSSIIDFVDFEKVHISFSDFWAPKKLQKKHDEEQESKFTIFRISFSPSLSGPSIGRNENKFPEHFAIYVHPIRSELRNEIRTLLISIQFNFVKKWLENYQKETWRLNRHQMVVFYNSRNKNIETKE